MTVFIIDDDQDDRELFQEGLESLDMGLHFMEAKDGADALAKLNDPKLQRPDLIFLDLNMPVMTGEEFLAEVKNHSSFKDIPVIIYSTAPQVEKSPVLKMAEKIMTKKSSFNQLRSDLELTIKTYLV
ncbi:response regulator [Flavobacterium agrisoli]|uniref:Response regulator n=1 Tax=Flavobacterium agrisoli TaxID=2793066 RepID=A0A934UJQ3_9FLAO|nr:response regulator [Flavobacterium agrisoli]MBK0370216.1 response regulator [Flavobacterium agrisoli]